MKILQAVHAVLFNNTALRAIVGNNIGYGRLPVSSTWPCVHYFEVSQTSDRDMDFDRWTIQVSAWSQDKYQAATIKKILYDQFNRLTDYNVTVGTEVVKIHRADIIDAGALPTDDNQLFGAFIRFAIKYRGKNIGGF
jgi:hypothetical protein